MKSLSHKSGRLGLLGWTVRDSAEKSGVHRNTITRAETNNTGPGYGALAIQKTLEAAGVIFYEGNLSCATKMAPAICML